MIIPIASGERRAPMRRRRHMLQRLYYKGNVTNADRRRERLDVVDRKTCNT